MTLIGNRKLKGGSVGGHKIKKIYCGLNTVFSSKLPVKPVLPSDTTAYPMHKTVNEVLMFAVQLGDKYGYYAPSTNTFTEESGMSGNYIERIEYVSFDKTQCILVGKPIHSSEDIQIVFSLNSLDKYKLFGYKGSSNKNTFYAQTDTDGICTVHGGGYAFYSEDILSASTKYDLHIRKKTGFLTYGIYINDKFQVTIDTGNAVTTNNIYLGDASGVSGGKFNGKIYSFSVNGTTKANLIPVKIMNMYCMLDTDSWSIPSVSGTLSGGAVTGEDIPFPDVIY